MSLSLLISANCAIDETRNLIGCLLIIRRSEVDINSCNQLIDVKIFVRLENDIEGKNEFLRQRETSPCRLRKTRKVGLLLVRDKGVTVCKEKESLERREGGVFFKLNSFSREL